MPEGVSACNPDWSREAPRRRWDPSRRLIFHLRRYQAKATDTSWHSRLTVKWHLLHYRFWSMVTGADVPLNTRIAGGLLMPHPNGVVIHPDVEIGPNCLLFQQVTLGTGGPIAGVPKLGGHVDIGAGAKVLGGVVIGSHARIGANAVVLHDVPASATVVGIPARVVHETR